MTDFAYKVIVIGNKRVGKTAFIDRYVNGRFTGNYKSFFAIDFALKVVSYQGCKLRIQFWDIAGQETSKVVTRNYFRGANACIIVFDITNGESFEDVKKWKEEVDEKMGHIPTIILANKRDLLHEGYRACVDDLDLEELKDSIRANEVFHISAKTDHNIREAMAYLIKLLRADYREQPKPDPDSINVADESTVLQPKSSCPCL